MVRPRNWKNVIAIDKIKFRVTCYKPPFKLGIIKKLQMKPVFPGEYRGTNKSLPQCKSAKEK